MKKIEEKKRRKKQDKEKGRGVALHRISDDPQEFGVPPTPNSQEKPL